MLSARIPSSFHQYIQETTVSCVNICPTMTFPQCTIPRLWGGLSPWPLRIMVTVPSRAVYVVCIHRSFAFEARFQDLFRLCCPACGTPVLHNATIICDSLPLAPLRLGPR